MKKKKKQAKKKDSISFKVIKGSRYIIKRDSKGRYESRRKQKGSGIRSRQQAYEIYRKTSTLYKDRVRIKSKDASPKTVDVEESSKVYQIGKNTGMIKSKTPVSNQNHYQWTATVQWGKHKTTGYSTIKGSKKEAFNMALAKAIDKRYVTYEHHIQFANETEGVAVKGMDMVVFKVQYLAQTFIMTAPTTR